MKYLDNKVALITGGGGGLGWGIAKEFVLNGAEVILLDNNRNKGEEVLFEINKIGGNHSFYEVDIRDFKKIDSVLERIYNQYKKIDVLVNNAGINTDKNFLNMTEEDWDLIMDTNLKAHVFLSQKIINKAVKDKQKPTVLFISSVHQQVVQGHPHYSSSKAGIAMLVKEMAAELASKGIRVVGIIPGGIDISDRKTDPLTAGLEPTVLLGGRNGIPSDVGRAAVFLVSDYWARHITGTLLEVSGGQYLNPYIRK